MEKKFFSKNAVCHYLKSNKDDYLLLLNTKIVNNQRLDKNEINYLKTIFEEEDIINYNEKIPNITNDDALK